MRSEKRSLAINELKEALKDKLVKKICGGRVWVVSAEKQEVLNDDQRCPIHTET
ncbi:TPA: hypothetical protein TXI86_000820 [Streptococcus suis]|uniref:hypothetical protein n=1 Tax=Streptococcus suis TaxID=1307 RepID=UPI000044AF05|nr:hypothetical protein [Streptococcus suis]ANM47600.1 hypothetical protein [Streptococcus phage phiZJ20091101-4]MCH1731284.1 hypothetical protein [Streptococcus suis]MCK3953163.1 hypothetical protein [Streptococcus suis]MCK4057824.1 hypothetical protein [Streptococcus suis]MDW8593232.1 hypothetical protein [Streptococcus suis]